MTDFSTTVPAGAGTPTGSPVTSASASAAAAAASLIHSASQINELSGFSSLAQVCQYGTQFPGISDHSASIYGTAAAAAAAASNAGSVGLDVGSGAHVGSVGSTGSSTVLTGVSSGVTSGSTGASSAGITPLGFTQEQVACVCEVLEQSGNIERLHR